MSHSISDRGGNLPIHPTQRRLKTSQQPQHRQAGKTMSLRFGVDTGGTFTDLCAFDEATRQVHVRKVSSTPDDPGRAIIQGVHELLEQIGGRSIEEISYFAHGTTVGTNALLTGRGVRTGLITTKGFRDLLELGRGRRPHMY